MATRQIKFRGFAVESKKWVYGFLLVSRERPGRTAHFIIEDNGVVNEPHSYVFVYPESIGQFCGLLDKNGKEIYEGDILEAVIDEGWIEKVGYKGEPRSRFLIRWDYSGFTGETIGEDKRYLDEMVFMHEKEVIGNIYENPSLLTPEALPV